MIYPIVVYGNPILKKRGRDIEEGEIDVEQLAEDMYETMHNASGVGLAAPQIGKSIRMFVIDASTLDEPELQDFKQIFINPQLIEESADQWTFEEGCLSIPEIREDVARAENLKLKYFDQHWVEHVEEFDDMKARIIQHEYDHIEGVLFTDHLSPLKKRLLKGKLTNISKGKVKPSYGILAPLAK